MAAVFDGDPKPLYDIILDPAADEFIRARMAEAIAMVTLNGVLPRDEARRFLLACYSDIIPQSECFVWKGWQQAIAMLGLVEFKSVVERAFRRGFVSTWWLGFHHFEEDLLKGIDDPGALPGHEYALFGDTIEELSHWSSFKPDSDLPRRNRQPSGKRKVGRNNPCPCGSGKKFKKCCLTATAETTQ